MGINRFINRTVKDLIRERFKSGESNDFLALKCVVENIEAALLIRPNQIWAVEKDQFIRREAVYIWGLTELKTPDIIAS